jgi:hypothetical protein
LASATAAQTPLFLEAEHLMAEVLREHKVQEQQGLEGHCHQNLVAHFVPKELLLGSHT